MDGGEDLEPEGAGDAEELGHPPERDEIEGVGGRDGVERRALRLRRRWQAASVDGLAQLLLVGVLLGDRGAREGRKGGATCPRRQTRQLQTSLTRLMKPTSRSHLRRSALYRSRSSLGRPWANTPLRPPPPRCSTPRKNRTLASSVGTPRVRSRAW